MPTVFLIHSSLGADLVLMGLITLLHSELAFSKAKYSISSFLTIGSDKFLFIDKVINLCKHFTVNDQ